MTIEFNNDKTLATVTVDGAVYPLVLREKEALVRDMDLATWLGFKEPRAIRKLITRWASPRVVNSETLPPAIDPVVNRDTVSRYARGGRSTGSLEVLSYLLTQADALFIATQAKTAMSVKVTKAIIRVFLAWQCGQLAPVAPAAQLESPEERRRRLGRERQARYHERQRAGLIPPRAAPAPPLADPDAIGQLRDLMTELALVEIKVQDSISGLRKRAQVEAGMGILGEVPGSKRMALYVRLEPLALDAGITVGELVAMLCESWLVASRKTAEALNEARRKLRIT